MSYPFPASGGEAAGSESRVVSPPDWKPVMIIRMVSHPPINKSYLPIKSRYTQYNHILTRYNIKININNKIYHQPTPPQSGRGMVGSAKYGFYAGLIPTQTNTLSELKPPQRFPRRKAGSWTLNPLANEPPQSKPRGILNVALV
jgi:hypothetical protein